MSKELKALYKLEMSAVFDKNMSVKKAEELRNIIENALKALEIIKNLPNEDKQVLLNAIYSYTKSEEKYDLLKEVLL